VRRRRGQPGIAAENSKKAGAWRGGPPVPAGNKKHLHQEFITEQEYWKAPMFPFDVILFDIGGVLLTNSWDKRERAMAVEHFNLDPIAFEDRHAAPYDAWERGMVPMKTYLDATVFYESRSFSRDDFFAFMLSMSMTQPDGALGILGKISASDKCMLGALNNEAREMNE